MKAPELFSQRAALRLGKLLDEEGFPVQLLGRANALATKLSIDPVAATQLLSGIVHWNWDDLLHICTVFEKSPGFFLDKYPSADFPSDTKVVTSIEGGESIVWRVPNGFLKHPFQMSPDVVLSYLTAPEDVTSMFEPLSLLVFASHPSVALNLTVGFAYVLQTKSGVDVMRCSGIQEKSARFEPINHRIGGVVVRFRDDFSGTDERTRVIGTVIGSISAH